MDLSCTMSAAVELLPKDLHSLVQNSKLLVVGAGGIGCELLKNLVLSGFKNIHVVDMDTIEVTNLNRQFLFNRSNVGQSKALVAAQVISRYSKDCNIKAHHASITNVDKFDSHFFEKFDVVLNALDNRAARSHVNRMCIFKDVALIESGSSGYLGHVTLHKKGLSECFDCSPRSSKQKNFPACTIRNTPSENIHCIVWAKFLFNQLFGAEDDNEDISPDSRDPEAFGDSEEEAVKTKEALPPEPSVRTRVWARTIDFDAMKLFEKIFTQDIRYLLKMTNLWTSRSPPTPLDWNKLVLKSGSGDNDVESTIKEPQHLRETRLWTLEECKEIFVSSISELKQRYAIELKKAQHLVFDKNDDVAMDFVTACSNLRCHIFNIDKESRFNTKAMAGNIIPAISATNSAVAGIVCKVVLKVLKKDYNNCKTSYILRRPNFKGEIFATESLNPPNPKCYVCSDETPHIVVNIRLDKVTVGMFTENILKKEFCMIQPDVEVDNDERNILVSSEEGEIDVADKYLDNFAAYGSRLFCDDFKQSYKIIVVLEKLEVDQNDRQTADLLYEIVVDRSKLAPKDEPVVEVISDIKQDDVQASTSTITSAANVSRENDDDANDVMIIENVSDENSSIIVGRSPSKRRMIDDAEVGTLPPSKKTKQDESFFEVILLD